MSDHPKSLLISGESGMGKSASLINIRGQEGVLYINCEAGKPLPFKNNFKKVTIDDPYEIFEYLQMLIDDTTGRYHTVVIDTISFMMERFEAVHVIGSANTMQQWGAYGQFFKTLMYDYVAKVDAYVICLGHLDGLLDENTGQIQYTVPVKGALKKNGLEAYFTTVINTKKIRVKDLVTYEDDNKLLVITDEERALGFKHVFQTKTTKHTVGDRIRSPMGLFTTPETYVDNDAQVIMDRLTGYYTA